MAVLGTLGQIAADNDAAYKALAAQYPTGSDATINALLSMRQQDAGNRWGSYFNGQQAGLDRQTAAINSAGLQNLANMNADTLFNRKLASMLREQQLARDEYNRSLVGRGAGGRGGGGGGGRGRRGGGGRHRSGGGGGGGGGTYLAPTAPPATDYEGIAERLLAPIFALPQPKPQPAPRPKPPGNHLGGGGRYFS